MTTTWNQYGDDLWQKQFRKCTCTINTYVYGHKMLILGSCHMGNWYIGCLVFSEDRTLLAPTRRALYKLVSMGEIC